MSSSNRVRVTAIEETTYGVTPVVGNFETARMTNESLSGTPDTAQSQLLRTDRLSSGQTTVGLTVAGGVNTELASEDIINSFIESAMFSTFTTSIAVNADLDIDDTARTLTRAAGDWNTDVTVGDVITLANFVNTVNNTQVMVSSINSAVEVGIIAKAGTDGILTESATGNTFIVSDKIEIGVTKKSFSMEKAFLDMTDKAINYRGMIVNTMSYNIAHGEIITTGFEFSGNDVDPVDASGDFITDGRTINAAATTQTMNGSVDMSFIGTDSGGTFDAATFCIQSVSINLNNNLTPQNCLGKAAPQDYSEGEAAVEVTITAFLEDASWNLIGKKITQDPIQVGFIVKNAGGHFAFYMAAVQVSGDDPAAAGLNQDVLLTMTGVGKVGPNQEKSLVMYKG